MSLYTPLTTQQLRRLLGSIGFILALVLISSINQEPNALQQVRNQGELHIISRNGPTTYFEGSNGLDGFEYTLAKAFADELGVQLTIIEERDLGNIFTQLGTNSAQFAAAGLTVTDKRKQLVRFTNPYLEVSQQLIYRSGSKRPKNIEDLYDKNIVVMANSAHSDQLHKLKADHPQLGWKEHNALEMVDLIEMVHDGAIDFTVVDSNAFDVNRNLYPRARKAFDISGGQELAWAFPKSEDHSLYNEAQKFLRHMREQGKLSEINDHFYGHVDEIGAGGALTFTKRLESRLPKWQSHLENAGKKYDLDWRLLAAISYQESHWNSNAKSYTGVRGLMMLTKAAAKDMGITDRVDPMQSIDGGARYFKSIYKRLSKGIEGSDRTWLALAAYNVGFGHLEDARILTERHGDNPNKWADVKEYLPLLSKRKYYQTTRHGYARGWEPVKYVQNIRSYYATLAWYEQIAQRSLASTENEEKINTIEASEEYDSAIMTMSQL